jgi:UDP-GlcNAc:undecaprenyl-phosphate GlcNAc-1-phosphate transferase
MITWWNIYTLTALTAAGFALFYTPIFRILALKTGFHDQPDSQKHKAHKKPTPLLGGPAICLALISTIALGIALISSLRKCDVPQSVAVHIPGISAVSQRMLALTGGAILATLLGLYDDKFNMSAKVKFSGQFAIAAIAVTWGGAKVSAFVANPAIAWAISVFWIVLVINAINFFDNMDGLAAGIAAIAFSLFAICAALGEQYFVAVLGAAAAGATIGFWFYNHTPASIFMGDSGSHLLGYLLAVLGCMVTYYEKTTTATQHSPLSILIPLFILALPLFDLLAVTVIRWKLGKPFYVGDNNHISHRFMKMGMRRSMAVLATHLLALTIGLAVLPLLWGGPGTTVVVLMQAVSLLLLVSVIQYAAIARKDKENATSDNSQAS